MKIDFLKDIIDKDEKVLWQKEVRRLNFMPTNRKGKIKKYHLKWYELLGYWVFMMEMVVTMVFILLGFVQQVKIY